MWTPPLWAGKCYVFFKRSAKVNLPQLDQNDLARILLKDVLYRVFEPDLVGLTVAV